VKRSEVESFQAMPFGRPRREPRKRSRIGRILANEIRELVDPYGASVEAQQVITFLTDSRKEYRTESRQHLVNRPVLVISLLFLATEAFPLLGCWPPVFRATTLSRTR